MSCHNLRGSAVIGIPLDFLSNLQLLECISIVSPKLPYCNGTHSACCMSTRDDVAISKLRNAPLKILQFYAIFKHFRMLYVQSINLYITCYIVKFGAESLSFLAKTAHLCMLHSAWQQSRERWCKSTVIINLSENYYSVISNIPGICNIYIISTKKQCNAMQNIEI